MANTIIANPNGGAVVIVAAIPGPPGAGGGTTSPTLRVAVTHAVSPFAIQPFFRHITDPSGGAIIENIPTGQPAGTRFAVKVVTPPFGGNTITINAPGGGTIEDTIEHAGAGMTMVASVVLNLTGQLGSSYAWECDGANNWTMVGDV